jgi:two-component system, NarL family, response regulator LiaR
MTLPEPPNRIRVFIVDDHAMFAESLLLALGCDDRIEPLGFANDALEGVAVAESLEPDVVLMDLNMPVLDGIDATRMLRRLRPAIRIVVVTASTDPDDCERALDAGAVAVVTKAAAAAAVCEAVHAAGAVSAAA